MLIVASICCCDKFVQMFLSFVLGCFMVFLKEVLSRAQIGRDCCKVGWMEFGGVNSVFDSLESLRVVPFGLFVAEL